MGPITAHYRTCYLANRRIHEQDAAPCAVEHRPHTHRQRQVLRTVTRVDAEQHRASKIRSLLGDEASDKRELTFAAVNRPYRTEDDPGDTVEHSRLPELHEHPIDPVSFLARIFQKENFA